MRKIAISIVATAGAAAALVPTWVWAQGPSRTESDGYCPYMMGWGGGWHGMILGPLFMIALLAMVIVPLVLVVRTFGGARRGMAQPMRTPLDTLKERFARGEIDKDEFEERRRVLGD